MFYSHIKSKNLLVACSLEGFVQLEDEGAIKEPTGKPNEVSPQAFWLHRSTHEALSLQTTSPPNPEAYLNGKEASELSMGQKSC